MSADNPAPDAAPPIFSVVLKPHRSLTPSGFVAVMAVMAALSFTAGTIFWSIGAWPVPGFMGLDVLLAYIAFRLNFNAARAAEVIHLGRDRLTMRRIDPKGRSAEVTVNPYWARLEVERHPEFGIVAMAIASHGNRFAVGGFLVPDEREAFAGAFVVALAEARATPLP